MHASPAATPDNAHGAPIDIRSLTTHAEWVAASALYRDVFGYGDPAYALSPTLLAALGHNGGTTIGAFAGDRLVGFSYGFTGMTDAGGEPYHYSQATLVSPEAQGRGLGRLLKHAQADAARALGMREMRWAFDPRALRNAHFNLAVLGAVGVACERDLYDTGDALRVIASWRLDTPRHPLIGSPSDDVVVAADASRSGLDAATTTDLGDRLSERLGDRAHAGDRVLVGIERTSPTIVAYRFAHRASPSASPRVSPHVPHSPAERTAP